MLQGYLSQEWTVAYSTLSLSGNDMKSDTAIGLSKQVINCLWTYAFNMWEHCCKLLADNEEGLKFTKVDNASHNLYTKKDIFINVDKGLFPLPLARVQNLPKPNKRTFSACKPPNSDGKKAPTPPRLKRHQSLSSTRHPSENQETSQAQCRKTKNARQKNDDNANTTTRPNHD
jgi:hypothetical protein